MQLIAALDAISRPTTSITTTDTKTQMSERATELQQTANRQITQLLALISTIDQTRAHQPCPGRQKLGDGTIAAAAIHTADNYQRIATFLRDVPSTDSTDQATRRRPHRVPRILRVLGHRPPAGAHSPAGHTGNYSADSLDSVGLTAQLSATREALRSITSFTDAQLDTIPPADSFRFCDGHRTLEQVLAGLLKHQESNVQTLVEALR